MKVLRYTVHNLMRISDLDLDLEGRHLFVIGGKNGEGKTSATSALLMALCGRSGMDWPEVALREGQDEGWVKVELAGDAVLENYTVELNLKRRRGGTVIEGLKMTDSDGKTLTGPRDILKQLYHNRAFDPREFETAPKKARREWLMSLAGLDFSEDKAKRKRIFDERTVVNRDVHKAKAKLEDMAFHSDAPEKEVSSWDRMQEVDRRQKHNAKLDSLNEKFAGCQRSIEESMAAARRLADEIEKTEALLRVRQSHFRSNASEQSALQDSIDSIKYDIDHFVQLDVEEIRDKIKTDGENNQKVRENVVRAAQKEELTDLSTKVFDLTDAIHAIDDKIQNALNDAQFPVAGLSVDDDGVLWNGLPFEQASQSERIVVSAKIGLAANPELPLLVTQHGSDLDRDTLKSLESFLAEEDAQMILEVVTRTEEDEELCSLVIEDGKAK
jgi:DNA repair exonuclease SbcCD ATPase subunit